MISNKVIRRMCAAAAMLLLSLPVGSTAVVAAPLSNQGPVVSVSVDAGLIAWYPQVENAGVVLSVAGPGGFSMQRSYADGYGATLEPRDDWGNPLPDGSYTWELQLIPVKGEAAAPPDDALRGLDTVETAAARRIESGSFSVLGGQFVLPAAPEDGVGDKALEGAGLEDVLHYDDVIITGSLCTGFDCSDGESFGFDTYVLKEHNLRIYFNDTSYTASYPTNSWRITINDSTNGGASYFSVDDVDDGTSIFKIEAGAPSNSLYVEDYGRVGFGTSTPVVELHVKDSDTPTLRLEQDSSGGWTAQTWDVAGNESNFFVRDVTNGSKLPFRIQPSTPSSTLCLKSDGKVGIGTWSPAEPLEVETTGTDARIGADRTDGARMVLAAAVNYGYVGTVLGTGKELRLVTDGSWKMKINPDGTVDMSDGGSYDGTWNDASSIAFKEKVRELDLAAALATLSELNPVTFSYKAHPGDERVGFIAEEVPELVASEDRQTLSSMDIVAVLTRVLQEQQTTVGQLEARNADLAAQNAELAAQNAEFAARLAAVEQLVASALSE